MEKKKKAFTLLELMITLSITLIVLATIYSFFLSNSKTMMSTEMNTDLQAEAQRIESELLKNGAEAEGIYSINGTEVKLDNMLYADTLDENGKLDISEITFIIDGNKYKYNFDNYSGVLTVRKNSEVIIDLSKNLQEIKIRPLDFREKRTEIFMKQMELNYPLF